MYIGKLIQNNFNFFAKIFSLIGANNSSNLPPELGLVDQITPLSRFGGSGRSAQESPVQDHVLQRPRIARAAVLPQQVVQIRNQKCAHAEIQQCDPGLR